MSDLLQDDRWHARIFTGRWSASASVGEVIEPATGKVLWKVGVADGSDVAAASDAAARAQPAWAATPPRERMAVFQRAAALLQRDLNPLSLAVARETGGILPKAQHEVREAATMLQIAGYRALEPQGDVLPSVPGRLSYARRVPLGVVGVISPFNFPLILSMRSVAPALAYGNSVVLKPDPQTPVSGGYIIARALEEAGLPEGVLQVLPGGADAGEALCTHPKVAMIAFTGSTAVGRRIGELAGRHLKKTALELGGSNSLIVLDDANLDLAVNNAAWGATCIRGRSAWRRIGFSRTSRSPRR